MYRVRWDRIVAVLVILLFPILLRWLSRHICVGPFKSMPVIGAISDNPELKALLLLAILLVSMLAIIKTVRRP